jgi:hypothetical protein
LGRIKKKSLESIPGIDFALACLPLAFVNKFTVYIAHFSLSIRLSGFPLAVVPDVVVPRIVRHALPAILAVGEIAFVNELAVSVVFFSASVVLAVFPLPFVGEFAIIVVRLSQPVTVTILVALAFVASSLLPNTG